MHRPSLALGLFVFVSVAGCGAVMSSMVADENQRDQATVRKRAEIDLGCPAAELRIDGLSHWENDDAHSFNQYAVRGCGRQAVYAETASGRLLDAAR